MLGSFTWYGHTIVYLFFYYSPVKGGLGYLWFGAISNTDDIKVMCTFLYEHNFLKLIWDEYPVQLMGHMIVTYLLFENTAKLYSRCLYHLCSHQQRMNGPIFPHPWKHLRLSLLFILGILMVRYWDLIVFFFLFFF